MSNTSLWQGTDTTSPTKWDVAANWDSGIVPVNGDLAYLRSNSVSIDSGLNQSAVTLAVLNIDMSYTGLIGSTSAYLQISATNWRIGDSGGNGQSGSGSKRTKIDFGSVAFTGIVVNTTSIGADAGLEPLRIKGTNANNTLIVQGGRVGVATTKPSETAALKTFSLAGAGTVLNLGSGVTWTTGYQSNGALSVNSGGSAHTIDGGTAEFDGTDAGQVATLNVNGGTVNYNLRSSYLSVTSITRSTGTATVTTAVNHGYATGDTVYISGANEGSYNGFFAITVTGNTTFTYAVSSTAPTPATGTIKCLKAMAAVNLTAGVFDASGDVRDIAIAAFNYGAGGVVRFNPNNPAHLIVGAWNGKNGAGSLTVGS